MSQRFLKLMLSETFYWLMTKRKNAFTLLTVIASRIRRKPCVAEGLLAGECYLGDHQNYYLTRKEYRNALELLISLGLICKVVTNRTSASRHPEKRTTRGTIVRILSTEVYDLNLKAQPPAKKRYEKRATYRAAPVENLNSSNSGECEMKVEDEQNDLGHPRATSPSAPLLIEEKKEKLQKKKKSEDGGGGVIFFSRDESNFVNLTSEWKSLMKETYPGVDVEQQLREMRAWLLRPDKISYKGNTAFISNWLSRSVGRQKTTPIRTFDEDPPSYEYLKANGLLPNFGRV